MRSWASEATDCDEHLLALLLMLKSYQHLGCFPRPEDVPEIVVDFVRRAVELPEGTLPLYQAAKTAKNHRDLVRQRVGVVYDQAEARRIAEASIRSKAAAKNRPADLINIALEKVVGAGLELLAFSTLERDGLDGPQGGQRVDVRGFHDRMSAVERAGLTSGYSATDQPTLTLSDTHTTTPPLTSGGATPPATPPTTSRPAPSRSTPTQRTGPRPQHHR
ncbi:DUF4158 domain-containing protein [Streptomyces malaysiensis]|uniref:DUF4158 domain-containing protein n=1 Tax=Streptomyces malaysiensis TaxID=92644 RepID=UPI002B2F53C4|nr:DUF4158 domain-containing protein [Streptomyces malaysiensis]